MVLAIPVAVKFLHKGNKVSVCLKGILGFITSFEIKNKMLMQLTRRIFPKYNYSSCLPEIFNFY